MAFSANVPTDYKKLVEGEIKIKVTDNPGVYLGILAAWGGFKTTILGVVKDKVVAKLKKRKKLTLSCGEKEVKIKAIASAIPTYTMAYFKFPKRLCEEKNSVIARFWWRSIHWNNWKGMTRTKDEGGLGFKDLEMLNQALLAKQRWRMIHELDALWVKVLKVVYFPHKYVLKAEKRGHASRAWSSLVEGKKFLMEEFQWQVVEGEEVDIWNDNWIPYLDGQRLKYPGRVDSPLASKVAELINKEESSWDLQAVEQWLDSKEI